MFTLGLNHRSAPLTVRERLAFAADALVPALLDLKTSAGTDEAAIVSTCNRTEIVAVGGESDAVAKWLCAHHGLNPRDVERHLYAYRERETVQHVFRVASGLDSMVLGEPQILGQMKQAYRTAEDACTAGPVLSRLFQHAFRVAKKVRSETEIGARPLSIAAAAASLTGQVFANLDGKDMLIVGAGDTARLVTEHLHRLGKPRLTVANRSPAAARELARRFGGAVCELDGLPQQLARADLVVTTVGGRPGLITPQMTRAAFASRRRKPVLMIDLAVPRNIDIGVAEDEDVYLYSVDDLAQITDENRASRALAAADAEILVDNGTREFMRWLDFRQSARIITAMRGQARDHSRELIQDAQRRLARGEDVNAVLERFGHRLSNRLLHGPSRALRDAEDDERDQLARQLARLFELDDPDS